MNEVKKTPEGGYGNCRVQKKIKRKLRVNRSTAWEPMKGKCAFSEYSKPKEKGSGKEIGKRKLFFLGRKEVRTTKEKKGKS